jgi:hypothetical protein
MTYPLNDLVQTNLLKQDVWKRLLKDRLPELNIVPQLCVLKFLIQLRDRVTECVTEDAARLTSVLVFPPNGLKLKTCIVLDSLLHLANVVVVELRSLAVFTNTHVLEEALIVECQRCEDLKRGRSNTTLVG